MTITLLQRADEPVVRRLRPNKRLDGAIVALVNRLARPREPFATTVEGLPLTLTVVDTRFDAPAAMPDAVEIGFAFDDGSRVGLGLSASILDRLVRAVQDDLVPRPTAPTCALLIELALAPLLDQVEQITGHGVWVETVGARTERSGAVILVLDGVLDGAAFAAWLDLGSPTEASLPTAAAAVVALVERLPARAASVSAMPIPVAFVAGRTDLTLGQLRSLQVGDAVLPDLWLPSGGEILVALGDGHTARATTDRHRSTLMTPFRPAAKDVAVAGGDGDMAQDTTAERLTQGGNAGEGDLDGITVTLAFELGRRTLAIGDLKAVGAGHVFDLGLDPAQPVDLVANGTRIGHGEIVEIGERIGIRVVRLFGQD